MDRNGEESRGLEGSGTFASANNTELGYHMKHALKKLGTSVRHNISLPSQLSDAMRELPRVNWSGVAADAFIAEVCKRSPTFAAMWHTIQTSEAEKAKATAEAKAKEDRLRTIKESVSAGVV